MTYPFPQQPPPRPMEPVTLRMSLVLENGETIDTIIVVPVMADGDNYTRQAAETALDKGNADVRAWLYRRTGPPPQTVRPPVDSPTALLPRVER